MAYNNAIPQPTDRIKSSQNDILQNFSSIYTLIGVDHVNFDDVSGNQGEHNKVTFPNYTPAGSPTAVVDAPILFSKDVGGTSQLFLLLEAADALPAERNISGAIRLPNGECTLPSGIKLKWGLAATTGSGDGTLTFAAAGLNNFSTLYTVYATIFNAAGNPFATNEDYVIRVYQYSASQFSVVTYLSASGTRGTAEFSWFAIGV